jgi:hypothetical protein
MAGAGAKKRLEENRKHVSLLRRWVAAGFILMLFYR